MRHHSRYVSFRYGVRGAHQGSSHSGLQRRIRFDKGIQWSISADPSVRLQHGGVAAVSFFQSETLHSRNGSFSPGGVQFVNAPP